MNTWDKIENWLCSYYRIYDAWHENKKRMFNVRIEWCAGWFFVFGFEILTLHTYKLNFFGFDITIHYIRKNRKYWGKKITK